MEAESVKPCLLLSVPREGGGGGGACEAGVAEQIPGYGEGQARRLDQLQLGNIRQGVSRADGNLVSVSAGE